MNPCTTIDLYESLVACPGKPVLSGIRNRAWGIKKSNIVSMPKLPEPDAQGVTMAALATISDNFGLAADKTFVTIDLDETQSNVKSESQGEGYNKSFKNSITLKYPGNNEEAAGFARMANVDDMLFVVQQRDGKFRILGNDMFKTEVKPSMDSGQSVTDQSGTTFEISVDDICPAPFYTGLLVTDQGTINCATGQLVVAEGEE